MKRSIFYVLSALFLLIFISDGFSQKRAFRSGQGGRWDSYAVNINLTSDQRAQLESLHSKFLEETQTLRHEIRVKSLEFCTLMAHPSLEESKIISKQKYIFDLQQKLQEKSLTYRLKARNLLTEAQLSMFPAGCGFGFALGNGYVRGQGIGSGFCRGKGQGGGRYNEGSFMRGRGMRNRDGSCAYGWR